MLSDQAKRVAIDLEDLRIDSTAQTRRALRHRFQHRLDVCGRAGDHVQYLAGRGLVLEGFAELLRPRLHLELETGIGPLQPRSHVVELVGERLELIAGSNRDALVKIAVTDARRAFAQGANGRHQPARKKRAGQQGQSERREQQGARALYGSVKRCVCLGDG